MHYKNGRPAQNGDKVIWLGAWGGPVVGILYDAQAGNDHCNGRLAVSQPSDATPNLAECLHIDDAKALLEPAQEAPAESEAPASSPA